MAIGVSAKMMSGENVDNARRIVIHFCNKDWHFNVEQMFTLSPTSIRLCRW
ncbi:MAG: hypothetical protein KBS70_02105 [Bacteroidales bacterium]|nr:hypothetical protein [Candidatus Colicola equi]